MKAGSKTALLLAVLICSGGLLHADDSTILARGFKPASTFQVNDFDTINTFNGNLMLHIPLGQPYTSNGTLAYQFGLHYNSQAWDLFYHEGIDFGSATGFANSFLSARYDVVTRKDGSHYAVWSADGSGSFLQGPAPGLQAKSAATHAPATSLDAPGGVSGIESFPSGNAGLGWTFSFGDYDGESFSYISPEGTTSVFHPSMHGSNQPGIADFSKTDWYTTDGTYMRLRTLPEPTPQTPQYPREVDTPDGLRRHFHCAARCNNYRSVWVLDWLSDPFGNVLKIDYSPAAPPSTGLWTWTITQGSLPNAESSPETRYYDGSPIDVIRTHYAYFTKPNEGSVRLQRLALAAPNGRYAFYDFVYSFPSVPSTIGVPWPGPGLIMDYTHDAGSNVYRRSISELSAIRLPDANGATQAAPPSCFNTHCTPVPASTGVWQFRYYDSPDGDATDPIPVCWGNTNNAPNCGDGNLYPVSRNTGLLRMAKAPTGGGYRYEYSVRGYPAGLCHALQQQGAIFTGISKRQQIDGDEHDVTNAATYYVGRAWLRTSRLGTVCPTVTEFVTAVISPPANSPTIPNNLSYPQDAGCPFNTTCSHVALAFFSLLPDRTDMPNPAPIDWSHEGWPYTEDDELCGDHHYVYGDSGSAQWKCAGQPEAKYLSTQEVWGDYNTFAADPDETVRKMFPRYLRGTAGSFELQTSFHPLRSTYVRFKSSFTECPEGSGRGTCVSSNLRNELTRVVYDDDSRAFTEEASADFDGLGHYRTVESTSDFRTHSPATGTDLEDRIAVTAYNTDPLVTYHDGDRLPPGAPTAINPVTPQPWFVNRYASTSVTENGLTFTKQFTFDPGKAFIASVRIVKSTSANPQTDDTDVVHTTARTSLPGPMHSLRITDSWLGGDGGDQATPSYVKETVLTFGSTESESYKNCDGADLHTIQDNTPDQNTGLALAAGDGSGVSSSYAYDALSRVTTVTPPSVTSSQTYTYSFATAGQTGKECEGSPVNPATCTGNLPLFSPSSSQITRGTGSQQTQLTYSYDFLGRESEEDELLPDGSGALSSTKLTYTVRGLPLDETTVKPVSGSSITAGNTHHIYDELGREVVTKASDGTRQTTDYNGNRNKTVTSLTVATGLGTHGAVGVSSLSDGFGRLRRVNDNKLQANYDYDAADHLTRVSLNDAGPGGTTQERLFNWDGRGFMISETHPEAGTTLLSHIDALGHSGRRDYQADATLKNLSLNFVYDRAERLVSVVSVASGAPLKTFLFNANDNTIAAGSRGRLHMSVRENVVPRPLQLSETMLVDVTTTYNYDDAGRLLSTTLGNPYNGPFTATTSYHYDALDHMQSVDYPIIVPQNQMPLAPARNVPFTFNHGRLVSVGNAPNGQPFFTLQYNHNGTLAKVLRQRGASSYTDEIKPDPFGMKRPQEFLWHYAGGTGDSGIYQYDSAGNISAIGPDQYAYDSALRLVQARIGSTTQTYNYDAFGNMGSWSDGSVTHQNPADPHTNRLLPPQNLGTDNYDKLGNVIHAQDTRPASLNPSGPASPLLDFTYDLLSSMTSFDGNRIGRVFLYDADDERVATLDYKAPDNVVHEHWYLRDSNHQVLRDFDRTSGTWSWVRDYVYRGDTLASTLGPDPATGAVQLHDVHVDHLGTTRLVTDASGAPATLPGGTIDSVRKYWPFGELTITRPLAERMAFTGHERDDDGTGFPDANLDYMHARYYTSFGRRFLAVDPILGTSQHPQSWNRYAYTHNSPINATDGNGRTVARLYGQNRDVDPGELVLLAGKQNPGQVAHVAVVAGFELNVAYTGQVTLDAQIYENAPVFGIGNRGGSEGHTPLFDGHTHLPVKTNSNSPAAGGAGGWNSENMVVMGVLPNRMKDGSLFTTKDVEKAAAGVGRVRYNNASNGRIMAKTPEATDCAAFGNLMLFGLFGTLDPVSNGGFKGVTGWGKELDKTRPPLKQDH